MCVTMSNDGDHVKVGTEDGLDWPSLMCVLLARLMMGGQKGTNPSQPKRQLCCWCEPSGPHRNAMPEHASLTYVLSWWQVLSCLLAAFIN